MHEKVITVRMPEELHHKLKAYCERTCRSMNKLTVALIKAELASQEETPLSGDNCKFHGNTFHQGGSKVSGFRDQGQNERGAD